MIRYGFHDYINIYYHLLQDFYESDSKNFEKDERSSITWLALYSSFVSYRPYTGPLLAHAKKCVEQAFEEENKKRNLEISKTWNASLDALREHEDSKWAYLDIMVSSDGNFISHLNLKMFIDKLNGIEAQIAQLYIDGYEISEVLEELKIDEGRLNVINNELRCKWIDFNL